MTKLFYLLSLLFLTHCSASDSDPIKPDDKIPDDSNQKEYPGKIEFSISSDIQKANILSIFYLKQKKNFIIEFVTDDRLGFAGFLMLNQLKPQSVKWQSMADSINGFIYEIFTGFDPDYEVRYYGVQDSGFSSITKIQNDTIYGNFSGIVKTTKNLGVFPNRIEMVNGTFKVKNKIDTLNFSLGYF